MRQCIEDPILRKRLAGWRRAKLEGREPTREEKDARNIYTQLWRERKGAAWRKHHAKYMRRRRRKNLAVRQKERASARERQKKQLQARKTGTGRSCDSCGASDENRIWSSNKHYCGACEKRGRTNGWCRECGEAKYKESWVRRPKLGLPETVVHGRGHPVCGCSPEETTRQGERGLEIPEGALTLVMDLLTVAGSHDDKLGDCAELGLADLARVYKVSERSVQRYRLESTLQAAKAFDPTARMLARPIRLVFDRCALAEAVRRIS